MPDAGGPAGAVSGLRAQLLGLTDTWRAMTEARLGIFVIETRRAALALTRTFVWAVFAACALAATWWLLVVAVVWWAVDRGATPALAIGAALLANLILIVIAALAARAALRGVDFAHTRRALRAPELPR